MSRSEIVGGKGEGLVCAGSGLVTLDVLVNGRGNLPSASWAGGSCGNVLTILAYLGWQAFPISRLGDDKAGDRILDDVASFGVYSDFIERDARVSTPIIVERLIKNRRGTASHRFDWRCPHCGGWLPRYRPVLLRTARELTNRLPKMNCFYFDRTSAGILELARYARQEGALCVFEPSGIKDLRGFEKAIRLSHVVKYSHERLGYLDDITMEINAALVVETLSESGLRYRLSPKIGGSGVWNNLDAFPVDDLRDAAGSGDWCTAGLIFQLGTHGAPGLQNGSARRVLEALNFGQALAALNCHFEGPRGAMYGLERDEFASALEAILRNRGPKAPPSKFLSAGATHFIAGLCPGCSTKEVRVRAK